MSLELRRAFSVSVFARYAGKILLIRHKRLGTWLPVGGEVNPGESPLMAAQRELTEETGLVGRFELPAFPDGAPSGFLGYEEHQAGSKGLHMNFAFVAEVDSTAVRSNGEFDDHVWVNSTRGIECPLNVRQLLEKLHTVGTEPGLFELARTWLARFNARDLDGLLSLYADDAVHTSPKLRDRHPETKGEVRGKGQLRTWWEDAMKRLPELRYVERHLTASGNRVFMEYDRVVPGEPTLAVAEVLVCHNGTIASSHVYHG